MARPSGEKTRCNGLWTEARFNSFIKNLLRQGTRKWAPIQQTNKDARTRRGFYLCAECKEEVPATIVKDGKRVKNVAVDHISPIIDPSVGFTTWGDVIEAMYCEMDNLQLLCKTCHDRVTAEERGIAKLRRQKESSNEQS
jgi:5-methylcytosine-specific restriction endonuclease McrA